MSFLGGPECSTGANPLAQFQKQTSADTSLQRDRLASRNGPQLNGFRSAGHAPQDAAFHDYASANPTFVSESLHNAQLEQLRRGGGSPNWAGEFAQQGPPPAAFAPELQRSAGTPPGFSAQDFGQFRQSQFSPVSAEQRSQSPSYATQSAFQRPAMYGGGFSGMQRPMMYGNQFGMGHQQPQEMEYQGKGKARVQELSDTDWEKQFEALSTQDQGEADLDQLDREADEAIERELNQMDEKLASAEKSGLADMSEEDWREHFGDEYEQWKDFDFHGLNSHDVTGPQLGQYMFEENNLMKNVPNPFEEGKQILREGGNLSLAALAFEAAVQRQPDFAEAWVLLGQAQAQNEKESPAIRALEQALKVDPNNLDALMGLAVSYTNEGYDSLAYRTLERWISIKYPQLGVQPRGLNEAEEIGFTERAILHEKVTNLFLEAAQLNPEGGNVDVDVQVGLGVLFYGSEDYDKAVDCFNSALNSVEHGAMKREGEEHLLWNRLGATLANSGRSEEAIEAYSRALEMRPNFVRARYNLGVSCINLGVHEEAANHLLGALQMHRVIESEGKQKAAELLGDGSGNNVDAAAVDEMLQQNQSTNLYDTLRRVFTQMGRRDLAEGVGPDMDLDKLRGEFDF